MAVLTWTVEMSVQKEFNKVPCSFSGASFLLFSSLGCRKSAKGHQFTSFAMIVRKKKDTLPLSNILYDKPLLIRDSELKLAKSVLKVY
jgi:hypothetical protein